MRSIRLRRIPIIVFSKDQLNHLVGLNRLRGDFYSSRSKVITDFELIKLPKKADVLVVETDEPITRRVRIFDYFKAFNIIEFKSVNSSFRVAEDLPKILIYTGGLLLNEKKATITNTTFTLLSSRKPEGFLRGYKKDVQKVKNGVYLIERITQVPVYVVCANEVQGDLDRELALIKEFSTGNERVRFIEEVRKTVYNSLQDKELRWVQSKFGKAKCRLHYTGQVSPLPRPEKIRTKVHTIPVYVVL